MELTFYAKDTLAGSKIVGRKLLSSPLLIIVLQISRAPSMSPVPLSFFPDPRSPYYLYQLIKLIFFQAVSTALTKYYRMGGL